ncbi:MAG: GTP cyclohydrolase I FolE [Anaerolineae bacterium]|nr:GTP cyclohydrolase I FolE [Anaerolineae bacterium]
MTTKRKSPAANGDGHKSGNGNGHHHDHGHEQEVTVALIGETEFDAALRSPVLQERFELGYPEVDQDAIKQAVTQILIAVGEDPNREGLRSTPKRVASAYDELLSGYRTDAAELVNNAIFDVEYDDMIIVRDIEYFSLCEHHMLPFMGHAHVAYIPDQKVIGLSKIPRIVDMFSRRLQVQERLTRQIAEFLETILGARGVAVTLDGAHMCSMMRGVQKCHSGMTTSAWLGEFKANRDLRSEFMAHIHRAAGKKTLI